MYNIKLFLASNLLTDASL